MPVNNPEISLRLRERAIIANRSIRSKIGGAPIEPQDRNMSK